MNNSKFKPSNITFRDFSNYNVNDINNELLNANWETVYTSTTSNEAYNNTKHILLDVLNRHAPFTTKQVKGKPSPWLDGQTANEHSWSTPP